MAKKSYARTARDKAKDVPEPDTTVVEFPSWHKAGYRHMATRIVSPLTIEDILKHANLEQAPFERPLNEKRVEFLMNKVRSGLAVPFNWTEAVLKGNTDIDKESVDNTFRINGQHSSEALKRLHELGELPKGLIAVISTFEINSMEGAANLFAQLDHRGSARTELDVYGSFKDTHEELRNISRKIGLRALKAWAWHEREVEGVKVPVNDDLPFRYSDEGLWPWLLFCGEMVNSSAVHKHIHQRDSILAAIYACFLVDRDAAHIFWSAVCRQGGIFSDEEQHPAVTLADWLVKQCGDNKDDDVAPAGFYRACIIAWNAYRSGKPMANVRWTGKGELPTAN
jgi:hypothetical protein